IVAAYQEDAADRRVAAFVPECGRPVRRRLIPNVRRHSMHTDRPILLRPKPGKWLVVALGSLAFVLIGIWMVGSHEMFGWLGIVFFGFSLFVSLICMLQKFSYFHLTADGFTVCSLFRASTIRWEDVTGFGVGRVFTNKMVMFNYVESYQRSP